jgi:ABC-type antimicrobial peptide transport system permease subunit
MICRNRGRVNEDDRAMALRLVASGVAIGLIVSLLLGRVIEAELWRGVKPYDPVTLAGMAIVLTLVALLACYIPARHAMRVDPLLALRYE